MEAIAREKRRSKKQAYGEDERSYRERERTLFEFLIFIYFLFSSDIIFFLYL